MAEPAEHTRFWQSPVLGGVELLRAQYLQQKFTPHVHDSFVFTVIESGAQRFRHRGAEHIAAQGGMVLINPDETHTGATAHDLGWRYRGFYPQTAQLVQVLAELDIPLAGTPGFASSVLHDPEVARAFLQVHRLAEQQSSALQLQTLWREAVFLLFKRHARVGDPRSTGSEPLAVRRAQELLMASLNTPPSLQALATAVNLSPFHFARVFSKATGVSPHHWLMQQRLACALHLLRSGTAPVMVAAELGFADQSHLSRQFKRAYGIGPRAFRAAQVSVS